MSNEMQTTQEARPAPMMAGGAVRAIIPQSFEECWKFANAVCNAKMAPKGMDNADMAMVAIMHGLEVGLTPMAALQSIAVVNGRPTIWGDGAIALVRASGKLESFDESIKGSGDKMVATCVVVRKGEPKPVTSTFSVEDAMTAGLWGKVSSTGKPSPWMQYPKRMLAMRARAFALRDTFADVLRGLSITEEVRDYDMKDVTPAKASPPVPPQNDEDVIQDEEQREEQAEPAKAKKRAGPPTPPTEEVKQTDADETDCQTVTDDGETVTEDGEILDGEILSNDDQVYVPLDANKFLDGLEADLAQATDEETLEEAWDARDPMAMLEGDDASQGLAISMKRRAKRRLGV